MTDYIEYRDSKQITNRQMVETLQQRFPRYGKPTQTMINNPEDYGVCLLPEAEEVLVGAFGPGSGLSISSRRRRSHANKNKPNRLYVRLDNALLAQVKEAMARLHFATVQDFVEAALVQMVSRYGGAA